MSPPTIGKLREGDDGSFREMSAKENPDGLALVYIPGLAALLEQARQIKGSVLSETETARISEEATVVAATPEIAKNTIKNRGYV